MRWVVGEIADVVGGTVAAGDPHAVVECFTQDSREIDDRPALFVPIVADRDGHDFLAASGATAAFTSRDPATLGDVPDSMALIAVDDSQQALAELGSAGRLRLDGHPVIGITGSVGKTTTKDFLAAILAADRPAHASHRSFNNEIGVPLTILNAPDDSEALVLEMGARGPGHIAHLCGIGRPTIGIVTTVGAAHTSEFGSVEAVAAAKGELVAALPPARRGGVAVLNAEQPLVAAMADRTSARVITFGPSQAVSEARERVWAEGVRLDDELTPTFTLRSTVVDAHGEVEVVLGARGIHLVANALAAAAAALAIGVEVETVATCLAEPMLSPMRMSLVLSADGTRILDDTYNANPMSTEAALHSLAALPAGPGGRRIAVLGEMAELGEISTAEHVRLGRVAAELGIHIIAVNAPDYLAGLDPDTAPEVAALASGVPEALRLLTDPPMGPPLGPDDVVVIKGSRIAGLEQLVELLTA